MGIRVAEYLGQRIDVTTEIKPIDPASVKGKNNLTDCPTCPFTHGRVCKKLTSGNEPICSVRKTDNTLWINCSERLCSTQIGDSISQHQKKILLQIGREIFSDNNHKSAKLNNSDICIKSEVPLKATVDTDYKADFIITLKEGRSKCSGPDRLIVEMQGGGETSNTGKLTAHIKKWRNEECPTNEFLGKEVQASTLETNAWRRQQEQFIVKGSIAMKSWKGYGIAFCVGTLLYDYLSKKIDFKVLPDLKDNNWTLAIITFKEDTTQKISKGPVPLVIDKNRLVYTSYQAFVHALINQGIPSKDAFSGGFLTLTNKKIQII